MFQGASSLNLDGKGRLSVPTRHRDALLSMAEGQVTFTKHPDGCLLLFPRPEWLQFRERMVDPTLSRAGDALGAVGDRAEAVQKEARGFFGRIGAWLNTWRAKK